MGISNFNKFRNEIIYERRNPTNANRLFEDLNYRENNIVETLATDSILFRARIVESLDDLCGIPPFMGFDENGSLTPPANKTKAYRANYTFIPYLYCAREKHTAIKEVRPCIAELVSVASIRPTRELMLLDFSTDNSTLKGTKRTLFKNLGEWFSKPVNLDYADNVEEYIPTQYISEYVRYELSYDGIKYKSAMNRGGINYVLFDSNSYIAESSEIIEIVDE